LGRLIEIQEKTKLIIEREKRGWSQGFVADVIGCSREYYGRIEKGQKNNPRADVVKNLSNLFAVPADEIIKWLKV